MKRSSLTFHILLLCGITVSILHASPSVAGPSKAVTVDGAPSAVELARPVPVGPSFGDWTQVNPAALGRRATSATPLLPAIAPTDLRVTSNGSAQDETSIAVDVNNENTIVGGFNDYNLLATGRGGNGVVYSSDGGNTFTYNTTGVGLPTGFANAGGDPAIAFDSRGRVYYAHLGVGAGTQFNQSSGVFVARSDNGGQTWNPTVAVASNTFAATRVNFEDKEFIDIDRNVASAHRDRIYISWTRFYEGNYPGTATVGGADIMFSFSDDAGQTWSAPIRLTATADLAGNTGTGTAGSGFVQGSEPEVGPDGSVYVVFYNGGRVGVRRSTDGGATFGAVTFPFGTAFSVARLYDHDGVGTNGTQIPTWSIRTNAFANIESDPTRPGFVYVVSADDPTDDTTGDGGNIIFARSTDFGATWGGAVTLNDDGGTASQVFPWMAAAGNGDIGALWYDARNASGSNTMDVYGRFSTDGGATWTANYRYTDQTFNPNTAQFTGNTFFGDYNGLTAGAANFHALWTDGRDGEQEIYYDRTSACSAFDTAPPVVTCPAPIEVECGGAGGTLASDPLIVAFLAAATATDNCPPTPVVTHNAPSFFGTGTTTVTFRAVDAGGRVATCQSTVFVEDTKPPVITCPAAITVECNDDCGAIGGVPATDSTIQAFLNGATATDVCDASVIVGPASYPTCFEVGDNIITFKATDDDANESQCTSRVRVIDTHPPTITVALNRNALWPPNHKLADITATVAVVDVCDPNPYFHLISITSNEPDNGLGDGDTANDIQSADYGTGDIAFRLRSERSGTGDGRVYTITYRAFDHSGNTADATATVKVAHDQGTGAIAATGWEGDGSGIDPAAEKIGLVVLTTSMTRVDGSIAHTVEDGSGAVDAAMLDAPTAYVGNGLAAFAPIRTAHADVNGDGQVDLVCFYDAAKVRALRDISAPEDGAVGMHFSDGQTDYLVGDIFSLGTPLASADWLNALPADEPATAVATRSSTTASAKTTAGSPAEAKPLPTTAFLGIYPNPMRGTAKIAFSLAWAQPVDIAVYDIRGARTRTLHAGVMGPGRHEFAWDGRDSEGRPLAHGVYYVRFRAGSRVWTAKTVLAE